MRLRRRGFFWTSEWPYVCGTLALVLLLVTLSPYASADARSLAEARWQAMCELNEVRHCPRLKWLRKPTYGVVSGYAQCGFVDGERGCPSVLLWEPKVSTLKHEMAHVMQWEAGQDIRYHGCEFREMLARVKT